MPSTSGTALRRLRLALGVTLAEVAADRQRDIGWLSRAERGERRLDPVVAAQLMSSVRRIASSRLAEHAAVLADRGGDAA